MDTTSRSVVAAASPATTAHPEDAVMGDSVSVSGADDYTVRAVSPSPQVVEATDGVARLMAQVPIGPTSHLHPTGSAWDEMDDADDDQAADATWRSPKRAEDAKTITCQFCGDEHTVSAGDIQARTEACPYVRFLTATWGADFVFVRATRKKTGGRPHLAFTGQKDRKPDPNVLIFDDELPMVAWMRFEHHMWRQRYSKLYGQPHRSLCLSGVITNYRGHTGEQIKGEAEKAYRTLFAYDVPTLRRMAGVLFAYGYRVSHTNEELRLFPMPAPAAHKGPVDQRRPGVGRYAPYFGMRAMARQ